MFNYSEYRNIIKLVQSYLKIYDFKEVLDYNPSQYCRNRHDIEFSIDRKVDVNSVSKVMSYTLNLHILFNSETIHIIIHHKKTLSYTRD